MPNRSGWLSRLKEFKAAAPATVDVDRQERV
jgi:hypothetical protein